MNNTGFSCGVRMRRLERTGARTSLEIIVRRARPTDSARFGTGWLWNLSDVHVERECRSEDDDCAPSGPLVRRQGLVAGAVLTETIFSWPGLGRLLFQAVGQFDTPVIIGSVVIYAYLLALTVFLLDILYALVDPRVKVGGEAGRSL